MARRMVRRADPEEAKVENNVIPHCDHGDVGGCEICARIGQDMVDPACRSCGVGTWLESSGHPALVCDACAARGIIPGDVASIAELRQLGIDRNGRQAEDS